MPSSALKKTLPAILTAIFLTALCTYYYFGATAENGGVDAKQPTQAGKQTKAPLPGPTKAKAPDIAPAGLRPNQFLIIPTLDEEGTTVVPTTVVKQGLLASPQKQIALTFDAGWLFNHTKAILDVLDKNDVKATFFLRGLWVKAHPELAQDIIRRGHVIGSHSLTHGHMTSMTLTEIHNEIRHTTALIARITGTTPTLFRPPYGEYDSRVLDIAGSRGYTHTVLWTVDSLDHDETADGTTVTNELLTTTVLTNATDKGIILMHVGGYCTVEALPAIIGGLKAAGFTFVKVPDMLPTIPPRNKPIHTVAKGDTLNSLAQRYGVSADAIAKANGIKP